MQTFAKDLNAKSGQTDVAFYAIARRAKDASWSSTVMTVVGARKPFVTSLALSLGVQCKRLFADSAGIVLKNHESTELVRGHTGAPSPQLSIVSGKLIRVVSYFVPDTFVSLATISRVVGFASSYLFWGVIVGAALLLNIFAAIVFPTTSLLFDFVFLVVVSHVGFALGPLFRSAIVFSHVANLKTIGLGSMSYTTLQGRKAIP